MTKQNVIELNHVFELYVPTQCMCKEQLDEKLRTEILNEVKTKFSKWFGGCSTHGIEGNWILPDESLANEPVDVVKSYSSDDAYDDYIDQAKNLAVSVADRLSQDMVLLTIDGKSILFPRSNPDDTRCSHSKKVKTVETKPVVTHIHKLQSIYSLLASFEKLADARNLFCGILNYKIASGQIPCANWPGATKNLLFNVPIIIADTNGFKIVFVRLEREHLSRSAERTIIRRIYQDNPSFNGLFVVSNNNQNEWEFINVKFSGSKEKNLLLRRIRVGKGERVRTAAKRLALVEIDEHEDLVTSNEIQIKHDKAFDVEAVTREFYSRYRDVFDGLKEDLYKQTKDLEFAHDYALQFLNRCMFLYFIQRKGWMNGKQEYLNDFWHAYKKSGQTRDTFFDKWLSILFFEAFNNSIRGNYRHLPVDIKATLHSAPYLNGGLFTRNKLDEKYKINVKDRRFETIFDFLEQHNFTISEDSPLDQEVAVDPEMIGKVYESLVNVSEEVDERGEAGIFYTERTEIDLMCRLSLVDNLSNNLGDKHKDLFYEFIFALADEEKHISDNKMNKIGIAKTVRDHLRDITVLDISCGSGSFLVGMLNILSDLIARLNELCGFIETPFERKKHIVGHCLYGVDVMDWAVHVAELRLWLALIVDVDLSQEDLQFKPLLPNLSFKIRRGDSIVQEFGGINIGHVKGLTGLGGFKKDIATLKKEKLNYYNNETSRIFKSVEDITSEELRIFRQMLDTRHKDISDSLKLLSSQVQLDGTIEASKDREQIEAELSLISKGRSALLSPHNIPFVWDISFVEIFSGDKKGFDIVIGNPPYVRQENISDPNESRNKLTAETKKQYRSKLIRSAYHAFPKYFGYKAHNDTAVHKLDAKSDLYIYFYFIGLRLLNSQGTFCFITSNSWLDVGYGADLQEFLLKYCRIKFIIDNKITRSFASADINTVISLFSAPDENTEKAVNHTARFVIFTVSFDNILSAIIFEEIEAAKSRNKTAEYRVFPILQDELLKDGSDWLDTVENKRIMKGSLIKVTKYIGNKWGGKYLRAPDIYWTLQEKGVTRLDCLGKYFNGERYLNTGGADGFFILTNTRKLPNGNYLVINQNVTKNNQAPYEGEIEGNYIVPLIKDYTRTNKAIQIKGYDASCLVIRGSVSNLLKKYIKWGEANGYNRRSVTKNQNPWFKPTNQMLSAAKILVPRSFNNSHVIYYNPHEYLSLRFYRLHTIKGDDRQLIAYLNSSLMALYLEVLGNKSLGQGVLDFFMADFLAMRLPIILDPDLSNAFENIKDRPIKDVFNEYGMTSHSKFINPAKDIKNIDDIIFDALNLSSGERNAVYEAIVDLVEARLKKANSLSPRRHSNIEEFEAE